MSGSVGLFKKGNAGMAQAGNDQDTTEGASAFSCCECVAIPSGANGPPTFSDALRMVVSFTAVFISVGILISLTHALTAPIIYRHQAATANKAASEGQRMVQFKKFFPTCDGFSQLGLWTVHEHSAKYFSVSCGKANMGYAIESYGKGYSSLVKVLVGVTASGEVAGIEILEQAETPGLGEQITEDDFKKQFAGKRLAQLVINASETGEGINAITGATISSKGVTEDAVRSAVSFVNSKLVTK
ncbi:MAG TPA: FMN-binding protein [Chitinivibrionales bacterium]